MLDQTDGVSANLRLKLAKYETDNYRFIVGIFARTIGAGLIGFGFGWPWPVVVGACLLALGLSS